MSRLAGTWAEKTFKLPRPIAPRIERSMANGFLFLYICKLRDCISEEDFEAVNDGTTPEVVMKNFVLLAKALKNMDITLSTAHVVSIISEEAGAAAKLVMKIKSSVDAGGKAPPPKVPAYKTIIKSHRPKEGGYTRPNATVDDRGSYERYLEHTLPGKDLSNFAQVHLEVQNHPYHTFKHDRDVMIEEMEAQDVADYEEMKTTRFKSMAAHDKERFSATRAKEAEDTKRWKKDRTVETRRKIRDTQYELAVQTLGRYKAI